MQKLTFFNYTIKNNAANKSCDIFIDGAIVDAGTQEIYEKWFDDTTPTSFKSLRNQIGKDAETINVYINSGGGQVTEAMAIHDYLVQLQNDGKTVNTYGRGLIASAATYILMASKNSTISANSWFMIHNVIGGVWGDVNAVENYARTLRNFNDTVTRFYANATGLSEEEIGRYMDAETWFNGTQAHENKFVKNIEADQNFTNEIAASQWVFNNTEVLQAYNSFTLKNKNNMDLKTIGQGIKDSILQHLKDIGVIKNDTDVKPFDGLADVITNALKPIETEITNAVTEATKDLGTTVTNAVNEALETFIADNKLQNADNLKAISDELEEVKKDIANKLTGEAGKGQQAGNEGGATPGITWKKS